MQPDILIFMSDQHGGKFMSHTGHDLVRTPHLDRIAENGTSFTSAYTSCPLCAPARMSFLTGQLPSKLKIFTNSQTLPSDQATFLHSLTAAGYETVLCGRMHFQGPDQRHGFSKRIFGDMTPTQWSGGATTFWNNRKPELSRAMLDPFAVACAGKGFSAVLEYDRFVTDAAIKYLEADHDKPQCIVVGTYGPHSPYIAPPELYDYYRERIELPRSFINKPQFDTLYNRFQIAKMETAFQIAHPGREVSETDILDARAAYLGMIEYQDQLIGEVKGAWDDYLQRHNREGLFAYTSDHGQQNGEKGFFAKLDFFEETACIPLVFEGHHVRPGARIDSVTSIMDIAPTLCEIAGAEMPPRQDGQSLTGELQNGEEDHGREVLADLLPVGEQIYLKDNYPGINVKKLLEPGRMLRSGKWKYIHFYKHDSDDLLFDLESDPHEQANAIGRAGTKAKELKEKLCKGWDPDGIKDYVSGKSHSISLISRHGASIGLDEDDPNEFWMSENTDNFYCEQ